MRFKRIELAVAAALFATQAHAAQVQISDAWIRALPAPAPSGGYFTLKNTGTAQIALTGAKSSACGMLMLHKSNESGGMSSMEDVTSIDVAPGSTLKFAPGGYHLMCMDATAAIKPGARVTVTLEFSDKSETAASFEIRNAQGK